jgi:hypothetical protein
MRSQEVIAFDGRVFARIASYSGTARDGGGELDLALGRVGVTSGDQIERLEWFDPDDRTKRDRAGMTQHNTRPRRERDPLHRRRAGVF